MFRLPTELDYLKYCSQQFLIVRDNQSIFKENMSECQLTLRLP